MRLNGIQCDICGKPFVDGDDVVVCPECGTPQHRACYHKLGHCVHQNRHAEGYEWKAPASKGPSIPLEQQKTAEKGYLMCSRCGTVNPAGNTKCELCGYPLKETGSRIPGGDREVQDEDGNSGTYAEFIREQYNVNPNEKLTDELSAREVAAFVGPGSLNFLYKFRAMLQHHSAVSLNLGAFFFHAFYCFYRKMYKIGAVLLGVMLLSYIPFLIRFVPYFQEMLASGATTLADFIRINTLSPYYEPLMAASGIARYANLIISVLSGLFFNHFYLKRVTDEVHIQRYRGHAAAGTEQYYTNLARRGGTSPLSVLLSILAILSLSSIISSVLLL